MESIFSNHLTARLSAWLWAAVVFASVFLAGCPKANLHETLQNTLRAPEGSPRLLAEYQPWFGRPGHIEVGYSSIDRNTLAKQIAQARNLGIYGFVVNWYGPEKDFEDRSYSILQQAAAQRGFKVAIMYDESGDDAQHATDRAIADLKYAYERYIGSKATIHSAYLTYNDRPLIFIFPKSGDTDWKHVREDLSHWDKPPLLIYLFNNLNPEHKDDFDGLYAWVSPGKEGWTPDGSNWGEKYLENFYQEMSKTYKDKIAVGAAWPGFDDSKAEWTQNRKMSARCGKTFADSLHLFRKYYDDAHPLPFLMIDTWNDYEEGTAIERGIDTCSGRNSSAGKQKISDANLGE